MLTRMICFLECLDRSWCGCREHAHRPCRCRYYDDYGGYGDCGDYRYDRCPYERYRDCGCGYGYGYDPYDRPTWRGRSCGCDRRR